ncbi:MAG TPA: hypothetical protein VF551_01955, partial [Chthoniobacterales bacterium]
MKWLSAGLTFVNVATVSALLLGTAVAGLGRRVTAVCMLLACVVAVIAYLQTQDMRGRIYAFAANDAPRSAGASRAWFWILAACFGFFAFRSFCWLLFVEGNQLRVQSPNNLGDLALHITYIRNFASGVPLWPENPIHIFSRLRYPAGTDMFNALLLLSGIDLQRGLIWAGLAGAFATFFALYRWGGNFNVAGFLFNGGLAGFQVLQTFQFLDYQGDKSIAWKSLPLSMLVTQRGLLYALPAGLLLLCHWRAKYVRGEAPENDRDAAQTPRLLPFWLEVAFYASMPLFHMHTFMALSLVAAFLFVIGDRAARKQLATLVGIALLPATFFVWTITDHFQARSLLQWKPGWVQNSADFAAPFFQFWFLNFGLLPVFVLLLLGFCIWRAAKSEQRFSFRSR